MKKRVVAEIEITSKWWMTGYGEDYLLPDPMQTDPRLQVELEMKKRRKLYERFPDLPIGDQTPDPSPSLITYGSSLFIAHAMGAPMPKWDRIINGYWRNSNTHAFDAVETVTDVEKVALPNWDNISAIETVRRNLEILKKEYPKKEVQIDCASFFWTNPITGIYYEFSCFGTVVDTGPTLMGEMRFFETIGENNEFTEAICHKTAELSLDFTKYFMGIEGRSLKGYASFGGDYTCLLSPDLFDKYLLTSDLMMYNSLNSDVPVNLHSCGASAHLYNRWAQYPTDKIVWMQTRGVFNEAHRLRQALPNTHLNITLMPPQFDFENVTPEEVRMAVYHFAEACDFRDLSIVAILTTQSRSVDENVRALFQATNEINNQ